MIKTIEDKSEHIKYCFDIIWKATEGKITSATFNDNPLFSVTFTLNNGSSETVHLGAPNVVLINKENFEKILKLDEQNNKIHITIDDDGSSFEVLEGASNNLNEHDNSTQLNEVQGVEESQNYTDLQSDEYTDSDEEIEEQVFDELTLSLCQEHEIIRNDPSDLSEDSLKTQKFGDQSDSEEIEQNFDKLTSRLSLKRKPIISETFRKKQKANESTIINVPSDLPFVLDEVSAQEMESSFDVEEDGTVDGQGAEVSQINNNLIEESESTAYSKRLKLPSYYAERLNELRKGEGMSNNFASNTNDLVGMCLQPIVKYFNEDSTKVLLEPLPKQMKDVGKEMSPIALESTTDN
ncbi:15961_t:CDS:10 [Racocetra fulgida]|uniref:15961_t:CDS:1 n=1 Tax=Racocetra fulgida TaxID=60492 RepID=A0A9N8W2M8_9GLOM|nr:15961_t:CDS:10 [Racocetra fulgida]